MSSLSVAMIVKNEEQFLEKVIQNVQPVADEIVIADTGSTDRTIDIINKYKLRLFHFQWNSDEAQARNFTISKCKSDWILFIDSDEFIDIRDYDKIRHLISLKNKYIAYSVIIRHYLYFNPRFKLKDLFGRVLMDWYKDFPGTIRIFKNKKKIFYSKPIFTTVRDSLRDRINLVGNSGIMLHHLDILRNRQKRREKGRWHSDVFNDLKKNPDSAEACYAVASYYKRAEQFSQAIRYYKRALKFNPTYFKARLWLGWCYIRLGKEAEGMRYIKACRDSGKAFPGEMEPSLNNAYYFIAKHMLEEKRKIK